MTREMPDDFVSPIACGGDKRCPDKRDRKKTKKYENQENLFSMKPEFFGKDHKASPRSRSSIREKKRRARISKVVKALKEHIPNSTQVVDHNSVLDEVIDYVKFLKLNLKALSQNRLHREASSDPFVYLEGYGHYLFDDQLTGEPLEETVVGLMEADMPAAIHLLNSKGLFLCPLSLADDLHNPFFEQQGSVSVPLELSR